MFAIVQRTEQVHDTPSDIADNTDPFYSESNIRELKRRLDDIKAGTAKIEEHGLIDDV